MLLKLIRSILDYIDVKFLIKYLIKLWFKYFALDFNIKTLLSSLIDS